MSVAAIILAAGRGVRFGGHDNKLTVTWRGEPILRRVAKAALASGAFPVILVTGHHHATTIQAVEGLEITIVENRTYAQGLSTSLRAGLTALDDDVSGALVLLGDMPAVSVDTLDRLIAAHEAASVDCIAVVPSHEGRRGNPALLRRPLFDVAMRLTGDQGAAQLFAPPAPVAWLEVADRGVLVDIDEQEDLARLG